MSKLTWSQQEVLRAAQRLPANAIFSRRNFGARQATMQALLYAKLIVWVDDVDDGECWLPYYRLTDAGKQTWYDANRQEVQPE